MRQVYAQAVLVCKSIAQQLFPGQDAVNRHIMCTDPLIKFADISPPPRRIVGVSAYVDDAHIIPQRNMTLYQPFAQVTQGPLFGAGLIVRAKKGPYALVPTITKTVRAAATTQLVEHTLATYLASAFTRLLRKAYSCSVTVPQLWQRNEPSHWEYRRVWVI